MENKDAKVYYVAKKGNIRNLTLNQITLPPLESHEISIKVKSIGLNFADIFAILGLYSATPKGGFVPGLEFSGIVEKVGKDVGDLKPGDQVMGVTRFGGYTTRIHIDPSYVVKMPSGWTFEEGAAFPVQALTAYYALFTLGNRKENQTVLIQRGAGGVGLLANRMAKRLNAFTIGTIGHERKIPVLQSEGYDAWIVRDRNFRKKLWDALGERPLHLILDSIGGHIFLESYKKLKSMGRVIVFGSARYGHGGDTPNWLKLLYLYLTRPKIDPQAMIQSNVGVLGFNLIWLYEEKQLMIEIMQKLMDMNLPPPYIGHRYDWKDLPLAIKHFQSGNTTGKVIVNTE